MGNRKYSAKTFDDKSQKKDVRAIIASVEYLRNEAQKAKFRKIHAILKKTVTDIEKWFKATL